LVNFSKHGVKQKIQSIAIKQQNPALCLYYKHISYYTRYQLTFPYTTTFFGSFTRLKAVYDFSICEQTANF